ncbi:MAG: hypothetical protein CMM87_01695 [Rickettsiales bacterium]|nr:hypothetical protein [Rickettsiales bacterium]|tara:strand:+ start:100 stop:372 length:273 start_codon:yes stop_codon:yes gene_type:complete
MALRQRIEAFGQRLTTLEQVYHQLNNMLNSRFSHAANQYFRTSTPENHRLFINVLGEVQQLPVAYDLVRNQIWAECYAECYQDLLEILQL